MPTLLGATALVLLRRVKDWSPHSHAIPRMACDVLRRAIAPDAVRLPDGSDHGLLLYRQSRRVPRQCGAFRGSLRLWHSANVHLISGAARGHIWRGRGEPLCR